MKKLFDHERLNDQSDALALESAGNRPTREVAEARATETLHAAIVCLGLQESIPALPASSLTASPLLQEAAGIRADLVTDFPGALDYAAGLDNKGDDEDDAATAVALLLAIGNACIDAAAALQALAGVPRDQPKA